MDQFRQMYFFLRQQGCEVIGLGKVGGNGGIREFTWHVSNSEKVQVRTTKEGMCKVGFYREVGFEGTYRQVEDYILRESGRSRQLSLF